MYDHYGRMGGGGLFLVFLALLVFFGLVAVLLVWAWSRRPSTPVGGPAAPTGKGSSARVILDERFARGEIDEEEYRRRRTLMEGGPGA
ncbi:MAG TPA: SHOCT domain-containing protein [Actinomycetes bacterium]